MERKAREEGDSFVHVCNCACILVTVSVCVCMSTPEQPYYRTSLSLRPKRSTSSIKVSLGPLLSPMSSSYL